MPSLVNRIKEIMKPTVVQISLSADAPTQVLNYTAKQLYNTQDNLSAVINFIAKSVAQLPLKVYRRESENNRVRDRDSVSARLLRRPNADQTEYEFINALLIEELLYGCVYVWVLPDAESDSGYQLRIIPTEWVNSSIKTDAYSIGSIIIQPDSTGKAYEIPSTEFVTFKTYSPGNPRGYVSPISALRQTLQEQIEAGRFRKELWSSSGRLNAQLLRPASVQPWDEQTRERFIKAFRESWGAGGSKAGSIPLLEDGMEIKPFSTSFKEQQWAESIKLSRESVAAAYSINPALIWHPETQTYASSKDNARQLYAECLGPVLQMLQQRINSFLLPMVGADPNLYVEFDLTEKLKGSFEERAQIMQAAVGGPWLTRNEARADNNLPPIECGDEIILPLNVSAGSTHEAPTPEQNSAVVEKKSAVIGVKSAKQTDEEENSVIEIIQKFFARQEKSILPKIGAGGEWWNADRWNDELTEDLIPAIMDISDFHGRDVSKLLASEYAKEMTAGYIAELAKKRAELINAKTKEHLDESLEHRDEWEENELLSPENTMKNRHDRDALSIGASIAGSAAWFGVREAWAQAKTQGTTRRVYKRWITGPNPRRSHAGMNGQTVPIDDNFSNGMFWPGDDIGIASESCNCNCVTEIIVEDE